jgi:hypothetical protein
MNQVGSANQRMTPTDVERMVFRQALADFGYNQPVVTTRSGRKAIKSAKKIAKKAVKHFKKTGQVPSSGAINRISAIEAQLQQIPMARLPLVAVHPPLGEGKQKFTPVLLLSRDFRLVQFQSLLF